MYPDLYPEGTIFREKNRKLELQVKNGSLCLSMMEGYSGGSGISVVIPLGAPDNWEIITKESNFDKIYLTLKDGLS